MRGSLLKMDVRNLRRDGELKVGDIRHPAPIEITSIRADGTVYYKVIGTGAFGESSVEFLAQEYPYLERRRG